MHNMHIEGWPGRQGRSGRGWGVLPVMVLVGVTLALGVAAPAGAKGTGTPGASGDSRATATPGNIVRCPAGMTLLLSRDGATGGTAGPITTTVSDPFINIAVSNANGFVNPLNGTNVVVFVKGGPNYNTYTIPVGPNGASASGLRAPFNGGGNIPGISHYLVCQDGNPVVGAPDCEITALLEGPPRQLQVTVRDQNSGLATIEVTVNTNASVSVPNFTVGTSDPVVVTATKIDPTQVSVLALRVTNVAGGVIDCDPPY